MNSDNPFSSLSPVSTARQLSSTALDSSSTAGQPRQQLSSCEVDSFSTASRQLDSDTGSQSCQGCQAVNSTARQLDSSTARQLRLGLPCMNWWLHLMGWLHLRSILQGRCPLTSEAIKGVHIGISPLHGDPSHRGVLAPGAGVLSIPAQLWGAPHTLGCPMMRHLLGHFHEHGITLGEPSNVWGAPHN